MRRVRKERQQLVKEIEEAKDPWFTFDGQPESLKWKVNLKAPAEYNPMGGESRKSPYAGGTFPVIVEFKTNYPMTPPKVHFGCPVYHPQVSQKAETLGHMCTDFVSKDWNPSKTIRTVLEKLLSLLTTPDPDGALEPEIGRQMMTDLEAFEATASSQTKKYAC